MSGPSPDTRQMTPPRYDLVQSGSSYLGTYGEMERNDLSGDYMLYTDHLVLLASREQEIREECAKIVEAFTFSSGLRTLDEQLAAGFDKCPQDYLDGAAAAIREGRAP